MFNIIKAEYKKFFKSKVFLIIVVLTIAFPIFMSSLYKILEEIMIGEEMPIFSGLFSSFGSFLTGFNPVDNFGIIVLIILILWLSNDFTQNTIKNKIIAGYSKTKIYLSSVIFTLSIVVTVVTAYAFLIYGFVGMSIGFDNNTFGDLLLNWLTSITGVMVVYTLVVTIIYTFKSFGASLGVVVGALFVLMLAYTVLSMGINEKTHQILLYIIPFLQVLMPKEISGFDGFIMIIVNIIYLIGIIFIGLRVSENTDY